MNYLQALYQKYFSLSINQKINERQHRNGLNINYLYGTVMRQGMYSRYEHGTHPKVNNGLYHHVGKTHSKYPK